MRAGGRPAGARTRSGARAEREPHALRDGPSDKNGVKTSAWAAWHGSFYFPGHGDGKCSVPVAAQACAETFLSSKPGADGKLTCPCPPDPKGTIYGSLVYTADSSLCAAALHAGAITKAGGKVTAKSLAGCSKYAASTKNGLTSVAWGAYDASFFFPGFGPGKCP